MNERYLIGEEGVSLYYEEGRPVGYEFYGRVPYYNGCPLSQISCLKVYIDGEEEPAENISYVTDTGWEFTVPQMITVASYHWDYGKKGLIRVRRDGGLPAGKHRLEFQIGLAVIYSDSFSSKVYLDFEI